MRRPTLVAVAAGLLGLGCEPEFDAEIDTDLVLTSTFLEHSEQLVIQGSVPILNGQANNVEWGSPDDPARPYNYVQLTAENGSGSPGPNQFLASKVAFTAVWSPTASGGEGAWILGNVYFLFQWADPSPSQYKDSFIYEGENLNQLAPVLTSQYEALMHPDPERAARDSMLELFFDESGRPFPENWRQEGGDDRLLLFFGDGEAADASGRKFKDFGLDVVQNGSGFGPLGSGFLDAWHWSASLTNTPNDAFNEADLGADVDPLEGFSGYVEDKFVDTSGPLQLDSGPVLYIPNYEASLPPDERVPLRAWIARTDPNNGNQANGNCNSINMGMDFPWLHRGSLSGAFFTPDPQNDRLFNENVWQWATKQGEQARFWVPGDFVSGYLLGHDGLDREHVQNFEICLPACVRELSQGGTPPRNCGDRPYDELPHILNSVHARAKGRWNPTNSHWVLEMARGLSTDWGTGNGLGNDPEDFDFAGVLDAPKDFYFAVALWDDTEDGRSYWGSPVIRMHFEPPARPEGR